MTPSTQIDHLCADQRARWRRGDAARVEDYLRAEPALGANPQGLLDLVYNEVVLREEHGEAPQLDEYLLRFPAFGHDLRLLFEVHGALVPAGGPEPASTPTEHIPAGGVPPPRPRRRGC